LIPGLGLPLRGLAITQKDAPQSVGLLCMSDQPDAETYPTTHNTHNRQTGMPPAGFEPTIPASERPQNSILDCAATVISE